MSELRGQRPRGIGDVEAQPVDGDDLTWDWWQALSGAGDLSHADVEVFGTLCAGEVQGIKYDVRTGPERVSWQVSTALYALERQLALLQRRLASVEAELEQCRGEL